jgi:hypothetical protein
MAEPQLSLRPVRSRYLQLAGAGDRGRLGVLDGARVATASLDRLDDALALRVGDLAEDDVLVVEPRRHNGGDEELGAVANVGQRSSTQVWQLSYVLGPALAMDRRKGSLCFSWKFSSANFSP